MRPRLGSPLVVAIAVALIAPLAACGGDDAGGDGAGSGGVSAADWCSAAGLVNEAEDALDDALFDPEQLEVRIGEYRAAIAVAGGLAPDEVRADVVLLADGVDLLDELLSAADYNLLDVDFSGIAALDDELDAAAERVQAYNQRECGFDAPGAAGDDDDSSFDPAAGSVRDQLAREFVAGGFTEAEARCVADNIDIADFADDPDDGGIDAVIAVFELCEIPLSRLIELGELAD